MKHGYLIPYNDISKTVKMLYEQVCFFCLLKAKECSQHLNILTPGVTATYLQLINFELLGYEGNVTKEFNPKIISSTTCYY
jgi:hypothetical protein